MMRKNMLIIPIIVISLVAFGTVSSANAFVGLTAVTVALAAGFLTTVFTAEGIKHSKAESAQKKAKKHDVEKKTRDDMKVSDLGTQLITEAN
jgi:cell division ATPase FtsA